jgi:TRAP transporter 4TM/12TM fusion protein
MRLQRYARGAALVIGFGIAVQTIYTSYFGVWDPAFHRPLATLACIIAAVLVNPLALRVTPRQPQQTLAWVLDLALLALVAYGVSRFIAYSDNAENMLDDFARADQIAALLAVLALIEFSRREFGFAFAAFSLGLLAYCLFGQHLPFWMGHAGFSLDQTMQGIWYSFQGVFGMPVGLVLEVLFIYIIFGVLLEATGAGPAMIRMAVRVTGRVPGGSAHGAIIASALFGTMSGSVVANVVGTGTFTIPMIKKQGFSPAFAGAVEAAASTGGQIMPPVMGASAFLMAQLTGINYLTICVGALLPALLYYASLFIACYFEAKRLGIKGIAPEDIPTITREDWIHSLMFFVPILVILAVMIAGRSPAAAGLWATLSAGTLGFLNKEVRRNPMVLVRALANGGISCARIMVAVSAIGVVIAGINLTGIGLSFAQVVLSISGSSLFAALVMAALACLVLGTGLPTLPSYLIIVLVMGPAIVKLGVPLLAMHMFVFYFGVISDLTPPVALAAFAAAPIAGANPVTVGIIGTRLAAIKYVIPFVFVYTPALLLVAAPFTAAQLIWVLIQLGIAIMGVTTGFCGFDRANLSMWQRGARVVGGFAALSTITPLAIVGAALAIGAFTLHRLPLSRPIAPNTPTKAETLP